MLKNRHDASDASNPSSGKKVPTVTLERFLLGELPAQEQAALEQRLATDPELSARLDTLRRADEEFVTAYNVDVLAHGVRERVRRGKTESNLRRTAAAETRATSSPLPGFAGWKPALGGLFLVALAAVPAWRVLNDDPTLIMTHEGGSVNHEAPGDADITEAVPSDPTSLPATPPSKPVTGKPAPHAVNQSDVGAPTPKTPPEIVAHNQPTPRTAIGEEVTRLKGLEPGIALFRRTLAGAEPLQPGARVKPGDVIRIGYRAGGQAFGAIFSVDGNGNVTRHWPTAGDRATRLERGESLLPGAFELDAAPDYERFYLITAERAFALRPVLESLHADTLSATGDISVVRFELLKENGI